jgi:5-methylcytosine-specific restriction endonuclease McrBC GTP-binding regulatory subunit McrB
MEAAQTYLKGNKYMKVVQFHPSYNYEDFVRGIKVSITEKQQPDYQVVNKTFGEIAGLANEEFENAAIEEENPITLF